MDLDNEEYKISVPIITEAELNQIDIFQDRLIDELGKHIYHDRELITLQRIILNQQKQIKKQDKLINLHDMWEERDLIYENKQLIKEIKEKTTIIIAGAKKVKLLENQIEEQKQIIDKMAEHLAGLAIFDIEKDKPLILIDKEEVKQYFINKVKENKE